MGLDDGGHPRFEWLINRGEQQGTLVYYVFDLLALDAKDLRKQPLAERKKKLERLLNGQQRLLYVEHVEKEGLAIYARALVLGLEGIVAKDSKSPYVEGPLETWHWQKIKNKDYQRQGKVEFRQLRERK